MGASCTLVCCIMHEVWQKFTIVYEVHSQNCEKWLLTLSFLSAWKNLAPTGQIFMKFDIWWFFENLKKMHVSLKFDKNNGYFIQRPMYMIMSGWIRLNVSDKSCIGSQNAHYMFSNFFSENCAINEIVEKYGRARQGTDGSTWCTRDMICMPHN